MSASETPTEIARASAPATRPSAEAVHICRNCGFDYSAVSAAKYCPECGQDTDPAPPTLREFVQHFFGNYIAVRGSFLQTLWRLISRPGALTRDYLDGRKRAYMLPLRLYLTVSVVSFLVFGAMINTQTEKAQDEPAFADMKDVAVLNFGDQAFVRFEKNTAVCQNVPDWLCQRAKKKFATPEARKALITSLPDRIVRYWAYAMFALVPLFAALLKLVYVRREMSYGSHIVFALHLHTFWLLAILLALAHDYAATLATFAIPIYAVLALRRVYGGGWIKTLLKAALVSLIYVILAGIAVAIVAIIALLL